MNNHDWHNEMQRRHFEPQPTLAALVIELLFYGAAIGLLGYTLGNLA
ncbi:hypothetical protein [Microbulbifer sp. JSM ZJ756]